MKSRSNEQVHSTMYKMSIARQIVCCKCTARHPPKVGHADIMVRLMEKAPAWSTARLCGDAFASWLRNRTPQRA